MNSRQRYSVGGHRNPNPQRSGQTTKPSAGSAVFQGNNPRREFVYWQQPGFSAAPAAPTATKTALPGPRRATKGGDPVLVEQLPSPISHIPTLASSRGTPRKSSKPAQKPLRPRMGVGVSMGVSTKSSTPKTNCASSGNSRTRPDSDRPYGDRSGDEEGEEEPIYCEIAKGDTPTKTPPSMKHGQKQQHKRRPQPPPPVGQRRPGQTANRPSTSVTSSRTTHVTQGNPGPREGDAMNDKRQARDFSFLRISEDAFKRPTTNMQARVSRPRQRRISCDVEVEPSLAQHQAVYQDPFQAVDPLANANMTASRMGRRAVTQVELALPSTRHFQARQQMFHDRVMTSARVPPINSAWGGVSRVPSGSRAGFSDSEFRHGGISSGRSGRFEQVRSG